MNRTTQNALTFEVAGVDRAALYRAAVSAALEALYGAGPASPPAAGSGVLPLQAAGSDESERLGGLLAELLREAPLAPGRLLPTSWLAFDERRATATLRLGPPGAAPRALRLASSPVSISLSGSYSATISLLPE